MPRLFVAIPLPHQITAELSAISPRNVPGVRSIPPHQMHLTLHFLGDADLEPVASALASVRSPPLELAFNAIGRFGNPQRTAILWAGLRPHPRLITLHAAIGSALATTGFVPESRPYHPHITLARCRPGTPRHFIPDFLTRHKNFSLAPFIAAEFILFSSNLTGPAPVYRVERSFALETT